MQASERMSARARVLLIDDDPAFGRFATFVLRVRGGFEVRHVLDPVAGLRYIETEPWDLVVADIELPGLSGLELVQRVRRLRPTLPVAVVTAHATVDRAVTALRMPVTEFLQKPIRPDDLIATAATLVERGRIAGSTGSESVLAIGAHPDDVEIGAAGALLAHQAAGDSVSILTLSHGAGGGIEAQRAGESEKAAGLIGARLFLENLEDTHIREGNPTIAVIDDVIAAVQPTTVYTHSIHDVHQDHRNTHRAAMVATRRIGRVYCFQSPSATVDFRPTHFVTIDNHVGRKLEAIEMFASQFAVRDYLEPDLIASTARYWSRFCEGNHAEAFEAIRDRAAIRPANDDHLDSPRRAGSQAGRRARTGPAAAGRT
jgi:two-component system, NtrC family, response regulator HydG